MERAEKRVKHLKCDELFKQRKRAGINKLKKTFYPVKRAGKPHAQTKHF